MRLQTRLLSAAVSAALLCAGNALAQVTIDGNAGPGDGYTQISVQNTNTQFGDNSSADPIATASGGSELNAVYAKVESGRLYVVLAGNLETNFNKMEVFIDSVAGAGQPFLDGTDLPTGVDAFCCGGLGTTDGALQRQDLSIFETAGVNGATKTVNPDYYLTFSNGGENVGGTGFWAITAHYAELNNGASGRNVAAGMQIGPNGTHTPLRGPLQADFDSDFDVDFADFMTWQTGFGVGTTKPEGDANGDGVIDNLDLTNPAADLRDQVWQERFGDTQQYGDYSFVPSDGGFSTSSLQTVAPLPGLAQGELIDQVYALGTGGCTADTTDGGAGCIIPELEFTLPVDSNDGSNALNHRDMENTIGLELGFDNSNIAGVSGDAGLSGDYSDGITTEDPGSVTTGIEFSIPLSEIGNPSAGDEINIIAYINGTGHDFASNQFAGDGVLSFNLSDNLIGNFPVDLSLIPGDQFASYTVPPLSALGVVPEPTSLVLFGLAGLAVAGVRRRG